MLLLGFLPFSWHPVKKEDVNGWSSPATLDLKNGIHVLRITEQEDDGAQISGDTGSHCTCSGLPMSGLFFFSEKEVNFNLT